MHTLEKAEEQLKDLLHETRASIVVRGKDDQELICDALCAVQAAIRSFLKVRGER